jgi:hypothetical protein
MPYTTGDAVTGDVWIDGDDLSGFADGDVLHIPTCPDVTYVNPIYEGAFLARPTSFYGNGFATAPFPSAKVRDRYIHDSSIRISSEMSYSVPQQSNLFRMCTGGLFSISQVIVNVSRPAIANSAAMMQLSYQDQTAAVHQLFQAIDLRTAGKRIIDRSGHTILGADVFGDSSIGFADAQALQWRDPSAALARPHQAQWSVTVLGAWNGIYEGMR